MHTRIRSAHFFDSRSVLLFAALTMGGHAALQARAAEPAQTPAAAYRPSAIAPLKTPTQQAPLPTLGAVQHAEGANHSAPPDARATINTRAPAPEASAFDRADTNSDGALSPAEAQRFPAISERFEQLDTDHDGRLSRQEFQTGSRL